MREIGVDNVDLNKVFLDIDELTQFCRFKDYQHENEPGCAVKEARYEGLNSKQIEKEKIEEMYLSFDGIKNAKNFVKLNNKR